VLHLCWELAPQPQHPTNKDIDQRITERHEHHWAEQNCAQQHSKFPEKRDSPNKEPDENNKRFNFPARTALRLIRWKNNQSDQRRLPCQYESAGNNSEHPPKFGSRRFREEIKDFWIRKIARKSSLPQKILVRCELENH